MLCRKIFLKVSGKIWREYKKLSDYKGISKLAEETFKSEKVFQKEFDVFYKVLEEMGILLSKNNEDVYVVLRNGKDFKVTSLQVRTIQKSAKINFIKVAVENNCPHIALWFKIFGFDENYQPEE